MEKQKPSKNSILVWRIRATLVLFGTAFILGALFVFFPIISSIIATLIIIVYILTITIYCPKLYKHTNFYLVGKNLTIEQGFFVKRKCTLSPERIQYIMTLSGPIQRSLGVCSLSFMTAGSTQTLQNITPEDALKIKTALDLSKKEVRSERKKS